MQAIAATARAKIIERQPQIIAAQKPLEGMPRPVRPRDILGRTKGLKARRNHRKGLHGLLVKVRTCSVPFVEAIATDRAETSRLGRLDRGQPAERLESD